MRKIALEEHFITHDLLKFTAQADFPSMQPKDAKNFEERLLDIGALRIEAMDLAGIDISVLSLTDPGLQGELPKDFAVKMACKTNDFLACHIEKYCDRFRGFACLPMQDPKFAATELERCVRELHFVGALINGQTGGHYLDEKQYIPFWEKVAELDVPIYLHPGSPQKMPENYKGCEELAGPLWGWGVETGTHALRLVLSGLFDRFPQLKLVLGHMGETLPALLWRFDSRWDILRHAKQLQKKPSEYIKENIYITTSGVCSNAPLLCAIEALGEDHVMFSVDYPYESPTIAAQFIEKAPITESVREKICYENAKQLLKLKETKLCV